MRLEWPTHGDIRIYDFDRDRDESIDYVVRFTHGRVEWIRPAEDATGSAGNDVEATAALGVAGRPLTADELQAHVPEKLELVDGQILGGEELLVLLLAGIGLKRAIELAGPDRWREALSAVRE